LPVPDDSFVQTGTVPTGEWRSLEENVQIAPEAPVVVAEAIVAVAGAVAVNSEFESFQTPAPATAIATATAPAPPELITPRVQRLNWGLELGQIPSHWWQEKRLTGRGVTLALLSTGADTQHPDLMGTPLPVFTNIIENQSFGDSHGLGTQAAIVAAGKDK
jgi:subtilisin family serine protease